MTLQHRSMILSQSFSEVSAGFLPNIECLRDLMSSVHS